MTADDDFTNNLRALTDPMNRLHASLHAAEARAAAELRAVDPSHEASARNLVHYLALRRHELRELQERLASVGLSSLGRAEPCVAATVENVLTLLSRGLGEPPPVREPTSVTLAEGHRLLERNTSALLGGARRSRHVRILVTLPSEAAHEPALVRNLLEHGMDAARVNCAHDDPDAWERMIGHVRRAAHEIGRPCRVLMDLAGPKLRTGALAPGPEVVKVKPRRDALGRVIEPASVWLGAAAAPSPVEGAVTIPVDGGWIAGLHAGDRVHFRDARDARRSWTVERVHEAGALLLANDTSYLTTGTRLVAPHGETSAQRLAPEERVLLLRPGSTLTITRDDEPAPDGPLPQIGCTLPQVFADVQRGDRIFFDDGAIGGRITDVRSDRLLVEITDAKPGGSKLRADKGINLPDTELRLPPLSLADESALPFVAAHADLVGYSFVRRPSDVVELHDRLTALGRRELGVVLKIETRQAFENLPQLLLAAMRRPHVGVMIARGDLAVECGWKRLAELQEEILWICEAAHLPVVWATQVLEQLAKTGRPSRAEITDAAMAERAECVMLNKGPHLIEAVETLDDILRRMEGHQSKKRPMLRALALAERFAPTKHAAENT
jgi:pyruvate kinase